MELNSVMLQNKFLPFLLNQHAENMKNTFSPNWVSRLKTYYHKVVKESLFLSPRLA